MLAPLSDEVSKDTCWGYLAELVSVDMFSERGVGGDKKWFIFSPITKLYLRI